MKIAFIGYGNIASALVKGILISDDITLEDDIYIFHNKDKDVYKADKCVFKKSGENIKDNFDIIFLCVKPNDVEKAILENSNIFSDNQLIVSVIAGKTIKSLKNLFEKEVLVARAMPNLCAVFNESITGLCIENSIDEFGKSFIENIFKSIGHVRNISESEMHSFTAIFGSGPAYIMLFIESLIECEEFENITKEDKSLMLLHLLNSTSKMLFVTDDIKDLRSKVTSKGGTTEAALQIFEKNEFSKIIKNAIKAARKKSIEISK